MHKLVNRIIGNDIASTLVIVLAYLAFLFVIMLVQAIALRFTFTWGIELWSWYREVLNNLAGAVGA